MPTESSPSTGQMFADGQTCEPGRNQTPSELMSSAAVSPVKIFPMPGSGQDLNAKEAACFSRSFAWFDNSDRESLCWRTWQRCLLGGWTEFSDRWPRSGMIRNGIAYLLPPLVPRISGIGCSLWPTPACTSNAMHLESNAEQRNSMSLASAVHFVPTPTARDWKGHTITPAHPNGFTVALPNFVKMFPTPQASDNRDRGNLSSGAVKRRREKGKQISLSQSVSEVSGQLNPPWVEWLMGFPIGWTDCEDLETPSSRK